MPLLEHCWYCSLRVAASVLAIYTSAAYLIAFLVDFWWIWEAEGLVPTVEYILTAGYLVNCLLAVILVRGISERHLVALLIWMGGMLAMFLPEAGLVTFMSLNYWRIHTVYGLTEFTFWMCRVMVNVCSLVCIQSLYSMWREENDVINSLREINKVSPIKNNNNNNKLSRRSSVASDHVNILNSYVNPGYASSTVQYEKLPTPTPRVRRSNSVLSVRSVRSDRPPSSLANGSLVNGALPHLNGRVPQQQSEFDAAKFKPEGWEGAGGWPGSTVWPRPINGSVTGPTAWPRPVSRSLSMGDLRPQQNTLPPPPMSPYGSLDRPRIRPYRSHSVTDLMRTGVPRLHSAYFDNQPPPSYLLDPWGRVVYVSDPMMFINNPFIHQRMSHMSLAESDDTHRIKDVAL